jgi:glycosyltransferase involved in cell wall biosynthesis
VLSGFSLRHATRVLVVDPSLKGVIQTRAAYDGGNILWVPTGYDAERWTPSGNKDRLVLTVASCSTPGRVRAKGIDFLARTAAAMPDISFRLIGIQPSVEGYVRSMAPPNLEILPPLPRGELLPHYRQAKVYCQPSLTEGLPNCVCEAMLCGAYPVGTTVGGIPTAIGSTGRCVPFGNVADLCGAIRDGLAAPPETGDAARARIAAEFTLERRERALTALLEELL